jgi:hypothetical protein
MVDGCIGGLSDTWYAVDEGGSVHFRSAPRMEARVTTIRPAERGELVQAVAEACNLPAGWVQIRPLRGEPSLGKNARARTKPAINWKTLFDSTSLSLCGSVREHAQYNLKAALLHMHVFESGGLWLPKQFLVRPRAYEMIGLFEKQQQQRQQRQQRLRRQRRQQQNQQHEHQHRHEQEHSASPIPPQPPAPAPFPDRSWPSGPAAASACVDDSDGALKVGTCAANKLHPGCDSDLHSLHGGVLYGPEFSGVTVADLCPKTCGRC